MQAQKKEAEEIDDQEMALAKKRIKALDTQCQLSLRILALVAITLGACIYCMYTNSAWLLLIMVVCACCAPANPMLLLPLVCSLFCYAITHIPTLEQIFTIAEDIYKFHQKYSTTTTPTQ